MENKISFGPFSFEPASGQLTRRGHRIKLQPKAAAILACLLEQPGQVVNRAQLRKRLWPEGTYVDYEAGIKVAVNKLRDALDDSSEQPVYIQTVSGEGYRFIAPVVAPLLPDAEASDKASDQTGDAVLAGIPPVSAPAHTYRRILWASSIAALVTVAVLILNWGHTAGLHFQNRDWVLIATFENRTGEKLLDGTMEYALERELSQSRFVNVAPQDRIDDTLKLMRQTPNAVLDVSLARHVSLRDGGIHAVVAGRIEKFGQKYVLTVRLLNPATGETAAVFAADGTREQLPGTVRRISDGLRRMLGENTTGGRESNSARLERVTTPSLEALRAFSAGMKALNEKKWDAAVALFEEATRVDPQFASAHIYAAHCYSNLNSGEQAAPHYQAAFRLTSGVSDRERLFILGSYYSRFLRDDGQALPFYQALVGLYPDDYWGVNNLASCYGRLGKRSEQFDAWERVRELRPNDFAPVLVQNLWNAYTFQRPDQKKRKKYGDQLRAWQSTGSISPGPLLDEATDLWRRGDLKGAAREVTLLSADVMALGKGEYETNMAAANLALGRVGAAEELCRKVEPSDTAWPPSYYQSTPSTVSPFTRSECLLMVAYARDDRKRGKEYLSAIAIQSGGPVTLIRLYDTVLAVVWLGETALAERLAKQGEYASVPLIHGLLRLAQGYPEEAIRELENAAPKWVNGDARTLWARYGLATALERQGKLDEAIGKLEPVTRPAVNHLFYAWPWPQCRAKVAALHRKAGRLDEAAKVENEIRTYLSEADPNYPVLENLRDLGRHLR